MRYAANLALLGLALLSGCWAAPHLAIYAPTAPTMVTAQRLEPGGKGLFVVRPQADDPECFEQPKSPNGQTPVDCASQYLVGCDASAPASKPFCTLMHEKGPVRDSIYPGNGR